jgi:hypothetical protein
VVLTNQNPTKKGGLQKNFDFSVYRVFPLIKVSPINPHMHRLLLGRGGVFFGVRFFLGALLGQRPNKGLTRSFIGSVARQRPISNNREVFSLFDIKYTVIEDQKQNKIFKKTQHGGKITQQNRPICSHYRHTHTHTKGECQNYFIYKLATCLS